MKWPLSIRVWFSLRRAVKLLSPVGRMAVQAFVKSQKQNGGYSGPGGGVEPYYTQFGVLLEQALKGCWIPRMRPLVVSFGKEEKDGGVYPLFFSFLNQELRLNRPSKEKLVRELQAFRAEKGGYAQTLQRPEPTTNATCAALAMLWQVGAADEESLQWLSDLQDETGGFRANPEAPIPDLLSTGVAAFTLHLCGKKPKVEVADFVESHWLENGGFAPTLLDEYSDVEYVFYGLLALGSR